MDIVIQTICAAADTIGSRTEQVAFLFRWLRRETKGQGLQNRRKLVGRQNSSLL
jgi:hypothetical protein